MMGKSPLAGHGTATIQTASAGLLVRGAKALCHPKADATRSSFATSRVTAAFFIVVIEALVLLVQPATAAEMAILRNGYSIRHEHHTVMGATTRLYLGADDSSFTDVPTEEITGFEKELLLPEAPQPPAVSPTAQPTRGRPARSGSALPAKPAVPLTDVVASASAAYHLDPDLVNSVIHAESGFNAHAVSPKGARGLMQLMPGTANKLGVSDAFDPQDNVTGGSRYLRELLERYNFDLVKALAAYNAGPERVEQYQGVPPFRETRAYVAKIVHEYNKKKTAEEKEAKQKQAAAKPKATSKTPHQKAAAKPPGAAVTAESR
jgi:Transglycosylase SLT domain